MLRVKQLPTVSKVALAVALVLLVVVGAGEFYLRTVPPDTVAVVVRENPTEGTNGAPLVVFSTTVHDTARARAVQHAIDMVRVEAGTYSCPMMTPDSYSSYDFTFSWRSIVTETVHEVNEGCDVWFISKGGLPARTRLGATNATWQQVARATGAPLPPSDAPQS